MAVLPEHFDQEKYWLLATLTRKVKSVGIPQLLTTEYEWVWCSNEHMKVFWGGRTRGAYGGERWPGDSWRFVDLLELLNSDDPMRGPDSANARAHFSRMNLEWFRPILEKLAAGEVVSYAEANEAYSKAHAGKPLRLYPFLASVAAKNNWLEELDYDY